MTEDQETPTQSEPTPILRYERREKWVHLPKEYPGFQCRIWINYPRKIGALIRSDDEAEMLEGLKQVVLEHNGWRDDNGNPLPQPTEDGFWDEIPSELAACILTLITNELWKVPNSLVPTKRR